MQGKISKSRRSHSKSSNGCTTCKRRHVRCDETKPSCHNCERHGVRCGYLMTVQVSDDSPTWKRLTYFMKADEVTLIENWYRTGIPPCLDLIQCVPTEWRHLSKDDLWLLHNLTSVSVSLHQKRLDGCTVWAQKLPALLNTAITNSPAMSAILGLSAFLMAHLTGLQEIQELAIHHRSSAIAGLSESLMLFPNVNHDGLLATSVLLSWQAPDRASWIKMQDNISLVLQSVNGSWRPRSDITQMIRLHRALAPPSLWLQSDGNYDRLDQTIREVRINMDLLSHSPMLFSKLDHLSQFLHRVRSELPNQTSDMIFERVQILRDWLFWLPLSMSRESGLDVLTLAVLAQFFGAALALSPFFSQLIQTGDSFLCALAVGPLKEISQLVATGVVACPETEDDRLAALLMQTPNRILEDYHRRALPAQFSADDHFSNQKRPYAMETMCDSHLRSNESFAYSFQGSVPQQHTRSFAGPMLLSQQASLDSLGIKSLEQQGTEQISASVVAYPTL